MINKIVQLHFVEVSTKHMVYFLILFMTSHVGL